jgi:signal peptidase I
MPGRIASAAAIALAVPAALLVLLPAVFGWQRYAIVSGSMAGSYGKGSLVLDDVVAVGALKVGEVITYRPPAGDHLLTHRIVWIGRDARGRVFRTKATPTPWPTRGRSGSTGPRRRGSARASRTPATRWPPSVGATSAWR